MRDYLIRKGISLDEDLPVGVDLTTADIVMICEGAYISSLTKGLDREASGRSP